MAGTTKSFAAMKYKQYFTTTAEKTAAVKTAPGWIRKVFVHSKNAAVQYAQIHDVVTTPATAAIRAVKAVPANGSVEFDFGETGFYCEVGITIALSTAQETYAAPGTDDGMFTVLHI